MKKILFLVLLAIVMPLSGCSSQSTTSNLSTDEGTTITTNDDRSSTTSIAIKQYSITFKDEEGNLLETKKWDEGVVPSYTYIKDDTDEYDYTVKGWALSLGGDVITIPAVSQDATYYAVVDKVKQKYKVSFYDENGEVIKSENYDYGTSPVCDYNGPNDTEEYDYHFIGWSLTKNGEVLTSLPTVTSNTSYYANVSKEKQKYTLSFNSQGGTSVSSITKEYGSEIEEPAKPTKENYVFISWARDAEGKNKVSWPLTLTENTTLYASWNKKIDMKAYLKSAVESLTQDPYSFIPDSMKKTNSKNHVNPEKLNYDFTNFTNVSDINYGGFGEQWHMVIENIEQSELFYSVLTYGEIAINASVVAFNNYFDNDPSDEASHMLKETTYTAKINFSYDVLSYTLQYKTNLTIPFFGEVLPQVDISYNIKTLEKTVRIQLTENNVLKYVSTANSYVFALEYGVETVSRKAYFELNKNEEDELIGHIYEFVQFKDKDLVPSCADFYINNEYTSVIGNKASGLIGFKGYINELYETEKAKMLGYEIREKFSYAGVEGQYNTLWFNLNNISGIESVKAISNENNTGTYTNKNAHDIYLNGSSKIFEPTYNKKLLVNTSRKYDVELRKQYFYGYVDGQLTEFETSIPMMFIQADNDVNTNFSDFPSDIRSKSSISASVNLSTKYIDKIQSDYSSLIDVFIKNNDNITGTSIEEYIGKAITIG